MRALVFAFLAVLVVAVAAEQYNPIRAIRQRRISTIAALEDYFDNNPLGQKIAQHILKGKELFAELRQRLRKRLADYIQKIKDEN